MSPVSLVWFVSHAHSFTITHLTAFGSSPARPLSSSCSPRHQILLTRILASPALAALLLVQTFTCHWYLACSCLPAPL
ncbi:uncharacterized protein B0H18DRAFT_1062804 [Fomitopsis serialis]|uniref:uncharacterized protein n=1 Tax=Fomitopsis serialis TaxID=139415 RepID=UPI00200855F1|nr:uncharacterized protein B0H18DRAFT_1062804 [Neoantrodia serialis]KAH9911398.1 hypothetical protein B0H18DRAFT_1062804 [Neoantrodia serialis]